MKRLKILFITQWYPTQDNPVHGIFVREYAKAVQLHDDVVVLHCPEAELSLKEVWCFEQETDPDLTGGIPTYRLRHRLSPIPKTTVFIYVLGTFRAYQHILAYGFYPDIVHAHIYRAGLPAVVLGKYHRVSVVLTEQFTGFPRRTLSRQEVLKAKFAMTHADLVLPVSAHLRQSIQDYGIHGRFQVVSNVVDTNQFFASPSCVERQNDHKKLLVVALLTPKKGIPYLLRALSKLRAKRNDFHLDVVGDGENRAGYEKMTTELGLREQVTFHGLVPKAEVVEYMRGCDFFVLPSLFETFGVVVIEALAMGKPVVVTDIGGPNEIVTQDVGILVPPRDAHALCDAIDYMLDHYQDYDPRQITQYVRECYSSQVIGKQLHNIYQTLLA